MAFNNRLLDIVRIDIDARRKHQSIIGFGGAFTDAAGINMAALKPETRQKLLESYFGTKGKHLASKVQPCPLRLSTGLGIEYNLARVPIGSTDFSTRVYSYAEVAGDMQMRQFSLAPEDMKYKVRASKCFKPNCFTMLFMGN